MENSLSILGTNETFIDQWHECYISDSKITGFVCTFQLSNKKHHFYGLNDIKKLLAEANKQKKDVYLSLNAFEYGTRTTQNLRQIGVPPTFREKHTLSKFRHKKTRFLYAKTVIAVTKLIFYLLTEHR